MEFFATAAKGTEPFLRDELRELALHGVRCDRGGVHFSGGWKEALRVCLYARVALRVLHPLASFPAPCKEELYDGVRAIDWRPYLTPSHTLAVTAFCRDSTLTHTNFTAQKVKDAIVDQQRETHGSRPDVDRHDPDVALFLHLVRNHATLYLDLAGESLHKRGYRLGTGEAPLRENLAAAMLRFSGWDRESPLCDPMCGSGTLPIEAALWARNVPPGLFRARFGIERWPLFDESLQRELKALREHAREGIRPTGPRILAYDNDPAVLGEAQRNAGRAQVEIPFQPASVFDLQPFASGGVVVSNPPYGKRVAVDQRFFDELAGVVRRLRDHRVVLLVPQVGSQRVLPLHALRYQIVFNGDLECRMMLFDVGTKRKQEGADHSCSNKSTRD